MKDKQVVNRIDKKRESLFLIIYFISFLGLYLSVNNATLLVGFWAKLKFFYIAYCMIDILSWKYYRFEFYSTICIGILFFYIFLFGVIVHYPTAHAEIHNHTIMMTYYLLLLVVSVLEINHYQCHIRFSVYTYNCLLLFVLFCGVTHLGQVVWNPLYIIKMLLRSIRVGSDFGFITSNYMGNFGFCTLIFSAVQICLLKNSHKLSRIYLCYTICGDYLTFLIMQSASSRSPSLSFIIFMIVFALLELLYNKKIFSIHVRKVFSVISILGIFLFSIMAYALGLWQFIWNNSNRSLNVTANLPYVGVIGNKITGMGFVENAAFQSIQWQGIPSAFGVYTSTLDMNYLFWYCTTGVLGCVIMGSFLLFVLVLLLRNRLKQNGRLVIAIYLSILFYGYWETVFFAYRFWPMLVLFVFILSMLATESKRKKYFLL